MKQRLSFWQLKVGGIEEGSKLQGSAQRFRNLISERLVVGAFSKFQDPGSIGVIGDAGFDFVVLDLEQGSNTILSLPNLIRAAEVSGLFPIVRVKENARLSFPKCSMTAPAGARSLRSAASRKQRRWSGRRGSLRSACGGCAGSRVRMFVDTIEEARKWSALGLKYLRYSVDVGLLTEKCRATVRSLRESTV